MTIPMPEPFAGLQYNSGWDSWEQVVPSAVGQPGVVSVFTQEQMEAYAAAKVREALEDAERQCRERADEYLSRKLRWQHHQGAGLGASICADAIQAMIDNQ